VVAPNAINAIPVAAHAKTDRAFMIIPSFIAAA
jgi:hypothetical protein